MEEHMGRFSFGACLLTLTGVSAADVAARMGVTPAAVSNYLNGLRRPPAAFFDAVRDVAGEPMARQFAAMLGGGSGGPSDD